MQKFRYNEEVLRNAYFRLADSTAKEKVLKILDGVQDVEFTEDEIALLNKEIACVYITMKDFVCIVKACRFVNMANSLFVTYLETRTSMVNQITH